MIGVNGYVMKQVLLCSAKPRRLAVAHLSFRRIVAVILTSCVVFDLELV